MLLMSISTAACHTYKPVEGPMPVVVDSAMRMRQPVRVVLANGRTMSIREPYVRNDTIFDRTLLVCGLKGVRCARETAISDIQTISVNTPAPVRSAILAIASIPAAFVVYAFIMCVPQRCMD
jgi:hypothetical protein